MKLVNILKYSIFKKLINNICGALRDLVPFVQFKKREKHPWRSVKWYQIAERTTYFDPVINNDKGSTLRVILKYKDHPSILAIQNNCKNQIKFAFKEMDLASIEKEIHNLKLNKGSQNSDIRTKIIKENVDIFVDFLCKNVNSLIKSSTFPSFLKLTDVTPLHKKGKKDKR